MRCFYKNEFCLTAGTPCKCFNDAGMKVFYYGKPFPEIFNTALKSLGNANPARTVMVGDTLETDILGANRAGIGSCLTLAHGITARNLAVAGYELTVDNIMRAAAEISAHPDFIIEKLPAGEL
jgi:ribonucleotide monophosphatase NagD (HAD superfamily)